MSAASDRLNPPQRQVVEHGDGPLLVLAGPGSGKTRVVTHRIARLLERGVPARAILAVTFTNKAAREMRGRVRALAGRAASGITASTFHSACVRILREEIEALGYRRNFTIYDQSSQESLMRTVLRDLRGAGATGAASAVLQGVATAKLVGATPEQLLAAPGDEREGYVASAFARYQQELFARNAVDFDDLILLTVRLFRERPEVLARWRERFRHVLVDEYQDTNATQDELLRLLAGSHRNLAVVGDDDQSIYGWRGAQVEHILHFQRRFPDATVVRLEQNYRSTGCIVAVASAVIAKSPRRHGKAMFTRAGRGAPVRVLALEDETKEADFIAGEIAQALPEPGPERYRAAGRHAVLFRTNEQMRPLEQALRQARVPYRLLGGRSFFDRKEVLDLLAYLRVAVNPGDEEALFRVLNVPARGLGPQAVERVRARASASRRTPWAALEGIARGEGAEDGEGEPGGAVRLPAAAREGVRRFVEVVAGVASAGAARSPTLVRDLVAALGYEAEIDRTYKDAQVRAARRALAAELQRAWEAFLGEEGAGGLDAFLDAVTLSGRDDDDEGGSGVTLATMHASKGLEFPVVYVAGLEEGILPHARSVEDGRALEEERRVLYVALTRAMERLTLTRCVQRSARGRSAPAVPSRFLDDLPPEGVESRDLTLPAAPEAVTGHLSRMRALLGRAP